MLKKSILAILLLLPILANAQVSGSFAQQQFWKVVSNQLQPVVPTWGVTLNDTTINGDVTVTGGGQFNSVSTTDTLFIGSYASSTTGFFTQGDLHIGGNATIDGTLDVLGDITGNNLSGTNTGDQDLSGFMLNTGDTATGDYNFDSDTFTIDSTNNRVGIGTATPGRAPGS